MPLMRQRYLATALERRRTWHRHLTVGAAALLCLLAQFSSILHMALVEHVRCAEHGELVHAHGDQHHDHGAVRDRQSSAVSAISSSSSDNGHGHDHCLVWTERRDPVLAPLTVTGTVDLVSGDALLAPSRGASVYGLRVYSLAPKTSPPVS